LQAAEVVELADTPS